MMAAGVTTSVIVHIQGGTGCGGSKINTTINSSCTIAIATA
jgi:hypothetical protein